MRVGLGVLVRGLRSGGKVCIGGNWCEGWGKRVGLYGGERWRVRVTCNGVLRLCVAWGLKVMVLEDGVWLGC